MELLHKQMPWLPPDWTVLRVGKYIAKLSAFIIVPGLHQITCRRFLLGGLLMVVYFAAEFTSSNLPHSLSTLNYKRDFIAANISEYVCYFSWFLLALDLRNLEHRHLKLNLFLALSCIAGVYYVPEHYPEKLTVYVEKENTVCPVFCKNDIVEFDITLLEIHKNPGQKLKIWRGQIVIVDVFRGYPYATKILAAPDDICSGNAGNLLAPHEKEYFCVEGYKGKQPLPYLLQVGPKPEYNRYNGKYHSMIGSPLISGINPRKIGNIREYYFLSNGISDGIGEALLVLYKLTGLNLFGYSGTQKTE